MKTFLYYVLRVADNTNVAEDYGAFGSKAEIDEWIDANCAKFGKQLVYRADGSVVYIRRLTVW